MSYQAVYRCIKCIRYRTVHLNVYNDGVIPATPSERRRGGQPDSEGSKDSSLEDTNTVSSRDQPPSRPVRRPLPDPRTVYDAPTSTVGLGRQGGYFVALFARRSRWPLYLLVFVYRRGLFSVLYLSCVNSSVCFRMNKIALGTAAVHLHFVYDRFLLLSLLFPIAAPHRRSWRLSQLIVVYTRWVTACLLPC